MISSTMEAIAGLSEDRAILETDSLRESKSVVFSRTVWKNVSRLRMSLRIFDDFSAQFEPRLREIVEESKCSGELQ